MIKRLFWFALGSIIALLICINEVYADSLGTPNQIIFKTTGEQILVQCNNSDYCYGYNFSNPNPNNYAQVRYNYNFSADTTYYVSYQAYFGFGYGNRYEYALPEYFAGSISAGVYDGGAYGQYLNCAPTIEYYDNSYGNVYWDNNYVGNSNYLVVRYDCSIKPTQNANFIAINVTPNPNDPTSAMFVRESNLIITQNEADIIINNDNKNHKETMEGLYEIRDTLTDSSVNEDEVLSNFEKYNEVLATNGTITNLMVLPVTLFTQISSSVQQECRPFELGELFGTNIILPCINVEDWLGDTLWGVIDILFSGFFVFMIGKKMIQVFDRFSSLQEGDVIDD